MAGILIGGGVALLCVVMGIILLTGHGFNMISGYNTMSKAEREKINEKALGKAVGAYIIVVGIIVFVCVMSVVARLVYTLIAFILIGSVPFIIWVNKSKRFKR